MSMRQNDSMLCIDLYAAGKSVQPLSAASAKPFEINAMHWQTNSTPQPQGSPAMFRNRNIVSNNLKQTAFALSDLANRDDGPALVSPRFSRFLSFTADSLLTLGEMCHTDWRTQLPEGSKFWWFLKPGALAARRAST
jgi:hypothetical protein